MKTHKKLFASAFAVFALYAAAIHAAPAVAKKSPAWVTDYSAVYPDRDWACVVESASNKQTAESNAVGALSRMFKVDVKSVNSAAQSFSQTVNKGKSSISENRNMSQQVDASSSVSGLMGVTIDYWTAKDGTVFACARINRKDGGATYARIINENIRVIAELEREAADNHGTFDAFECLAVASDLAVLSDGYLEILSVLNPAVRASIQVAYGNANTVKKLALDNTRSIVIAVQVDGDANGRVKKAFQQVFTKRGFRTTDTPDSSAYTLFADYSVSEAQFADNPYKFARYELKAVISDFYGTELFAFSISDREGHASYTEAAGRALRKSETAITDVTDTESFASVFDDYLASLLK